jgi:hypothetical protein
MPSVYHWRSVDVVLRERLLDLKDITEKKEHSKTPKKKPHTKNTAVFLRKHHYGGLTGRFRHSTDFALRGFDFGLSTGVIASNYPCLVPSRFHWSWASVRPMQKSGYETTTTQRSLPENLTEGLSMSREHRTLCLIDSTPNFFKSSVHIALCSYVRWTENVNC